MRYKFMYSIIFVMLISLVVICFSTKIYQNKNNSDTIKNCNNKVNQNNIKKKDLNNWDIEKLRQTLNIKVDTKILFQHYDDFNNNNKEELIIAFGDNYENKKDYIEDIYYIEKNNDVYEILSHIKDSAYGIYSIELINLINTKLPVLYCKNTNYADLTGFELYEIKDNSLRQLIYSASPLGIGHDEMLENDNVYYGFVQCRKIYSSLCKNIKRYYKFINGIFEIDDISIELNNYPQTPENIVLRYIKIYNLIELEGNDIHDIDSKLKELCPRMFPLPIWYDYDITVEHNNKNENELEFSTKIYEQSNTAEVNVKYTGDDYKPEVVYFLKKCENKWIIYDCKVLFENNSEIYKTITDYFDSISMKDENNILYNKYKDILLNKTPITFNNITGNDKNSYYLNDITIDGFWMKPGGFSLIDMNDDLVPELIIRRSFGILIVTLVIREFEDKMIVNEFYNRQMYNLKKDGTFGATGGAFNSGYYKLEFDNSSYHINTIAKTDIKEDLDGNFIPIYYIGNTLTEEKEFWKFYNKLENKEDVDWIYISY